MVKNRRSQSIVEENLAYYEGGEEVFSLGWIGPRLEPKDEHYEEVMEAIAKVFQSSNKIKECIDRHRNAIVGKKPHWYFADPAGNRVEDDTASVAELLLQCWIDRQYRLAISSESALTNAIAECTKNMLVTGRGYLRLWSPKRFRNSPDLINRVALHSPHPDSVIINRDDDEFTDSIEYHYTFGELKRVEVQRIDEVSNFTIFTTLDEQGIEIEEETIALDLGGRYSIYEMRSPSLITDSVKRAQNAINFALTMMIRNAEVGGFRERLILGAQPPGRWEDDKFYPDNEFRVGPGQTAFLQGAPLHDEMGQLKGYTNPSVYSAEPVSPQTFIDTAQAFTANIYHQFSQSHLLGSDLQLSGVSREQARQDFETTLGEHSDIVAAAIAGAYGSALMMLNQDSTDTYRNLDIVVQLRLSATSPLPEELDRILKFQQAGLLSKATAMSLSGFIEDTDAELALLAEEDRDRTVVEDTTSLLVSGAIDQPTAEATLRSRRVLAQDTNSSDRTNEVLNGNN
ncbi:phage portal protein [Chroococcidiopsis sp.]|uniref:phage portal protein n=1 Tax=Chroococcidiopsis sp. TaxID=3088168 RepID=UPI003F36EF0C